MLGPDNAVDDRSPDAVDRRSPTSTRSSRSEPVLFVEIPHRSDLRAAVFVLAVQGENRQCIAGDTS